MYWYILIVASDDLVTLVFIFYEHIFFGNLRTVKYNRVKVFDIQIAQPLHLASFLQEIFNRLRLHIFMDVKETGVNRLKYDFAEIKVRSGWYNGGDDLI